MSAIIFPLSTTPGERAGEGTGRLINCFAEPHLGQDKKHQQHILKRAPGARLFATQTVEGYRGGIVVGSTFYFAVTGFVKSATSGGVVSTIGTLSGSDKVFWARNNNATPDVVVVCADGAFVVTTSVDPYPDVDVGAPNAVDFLDGYLFFTYGGGEVRTTGLNTTDIDSSDFITAESKPDGLWRPVRWNNQMLFTGTQSIEVWTGNPVNDTGFPFNRVTSINRGLIGTNAIAGFEDGFGDMLGFVGDDGRVYRLNNYQVEAISPPDLDRLIERVSDKTTLEATVYKAGGHAFWQLSCDDWTWVFNVNNGKWHERQSYLSDRSRLTQAAFAFNKWICGDTDSGNLLEITNVTAQENGDPFIATAISQPAASFANRIRVDRADFDFATGVGSAVGTDPIETDPAVGLSWSDDGGQNWSVPAIRKVGRQARAGTRVSVDRCGVTSQVGRMWKVEMSDPVHFGLMGGEQTLRVGTK